MADRTLTRPGFSASRAERRAVVGSPPALTTHATILAAAVQTTDFEGGLFDPYLPFTRLLIHNNSDQELTLRVQGQDPAGVRIFARESRTFGGPGFAVRLFSITNNGAAATGANTVFTEARVEPADADTQARLTIADRFRGLLRRG